MRRLTLLAVAAFLWMAAPASAGTPHVWQNGETVVTFTFDGGYKDQTLAADILAMHQLAGTFYVNSGYVGYPAYLDLNGLRTIARDRSEIGGGSLYNDNLGKISADRARQEVCDDRASLSQLGFQVTSFSYPYGVDEPAVKAVVEGCGYNNARSVAGLYVAPEECASCPLAETLPPTDDFRIRTLSVGNVVPLIEQHITEIARNGGGWAPITFNHVCVCKGLGPESITPSNFEKLVTWVAAQPNARVLTMDQVMGGDLKPITGTPLARIMPLGFKMPPQPPTPASSRAAWSIGGFNFDQSQVMEFGIAIGLAVVITFRVATRGKRYVRN